MAHRANSLFVFLIKDISYFFKIRKYKKLKNDVAVFFTKHHQRRDPPWFKITKKVGWSITFFEAAPFYFLITLLAALLAPWKCTMTWIQFFNIDWSRSYSFLRFPEFINKKFMQENRLGWYKDDNGKQVRERSKKYGISVSPTHVSFFHFSITLLQKEKRVRQKKHLWFKFLCLKAPGEEYLYHYFLTVPRLIERLIFSSPVARKAVLDVISWHLNQGRQGERIELTYYDQFQTMDDHKAISLRTLERLPIDPPELADVYYSGIDLYKDYSTDQFYNWWDELKLKGEEHADFKKARDFSAKDSLRTLLVKNGFKEKAIPQVFVIRMVRHPEGNTYCYV
jgi:hypothetical protein